MPLRIFCAALLCAVAASTVAARDPAGDNAGAAIQALPSGTAASDQCELHVWPSSGLRSVYHGWLHGGIVDGAVTGREGYPKLPADPLTTARQVGLLADAGLDDLLGRPGYKLVIHAEPLSSPVIRQSRTRLTASLSPCYSELILEDVFFQEDIVNGSSLKSLIRLRDFGDGDSPRTQFGTWTRTPLKIFPPKEPGSNEAAIAELDGAFRANLAEFVAARGGGKDRTRGK